MIAIRKNCASNSSDWQTNFLALLPEIQARLQLDFRDRDVAAQEEAIADATVLCLLSFVKLHEQGRTEAVTALNLTCYAAKRIRSGRSAGCRLNSKEPLSQYAQRRRGIRVEQLHANNSHDREWIDALAHDRRSSVLDHVAARLDIAAWLATLCRRTRQIAADLAQGFTTTEVATKFGVTAGRISQLRQELKNSWREFQHEPALST